MQSFQYVKAKTVPDALAKTQVAKKFIAGGTTLIDLMKLEVENPRMLFDVNQLPWNKIEMTDTGLRIGAVVTNADLAQHKDVKNQYTVLSQALMAGASPQLRNKATTGGNLLQRTRCTYFRDASQACNKRNPGSGCPAMEGHNRNLAILGTSDQCIATNPSDMNIALVALEAKIHLQSAGGERTVEIADFHVVPGKTPQVETVLQDNELISGITLPKLTAGTTSYYLKLRDRASYEFALSSAAIVIAMKAGKIERIRIAMGGIGTKPWRVPAAEKMLEGSAPSPEKFQAATTEFLKGAKAYSENKFKVELARRCLMSALKTATGGRTA